ncbi:class I adenylate-forming enzyme family protein [Actinoplanes sp. N902-109]|uniref:class I adenylate-forming enzyme family protein n=1 Tax=Actinoplanes sp. (strain N902-109) TaxID=649831 RepID=UPI00032954AA|nr:fatty acid--CoA ligase family protein [Actinoplanes sp. N902-109]AGL20660.1 AMP-dependent synthetase and ligase [Actinoplanes sp. N902-109]
MEHPFLTRLAGFGSNEAVVFDGHVYDYTDLAGMVRDWQRYLTRQGVTAGTVVELASPCTVHGCAALIALVTLGAIVAPIGSPSPAKRAEYRDIARPEIVVAVSPDGDRQAEPSGMTAAHPLYDRLRADRRPGLVLFSSGTSGRCKASVLDFTKVLARYHGRGRRQRILTFLSLDHIGGINTLLHTLSHGGTVVTVATRTPDAVFEALARHRVEVLPTTPTFLNMVLVSRAYERHQADALRLVTYGTEPMPVETLQRLRTALPGVRLKQTYGLSELGILPTKSRDDDTLWVKLGGAGFDHKIVDGILWIRSDMAMLGYLNAVADFDEDGYFNTQDVVEVDGDWVRILGRRSEIINVGGEKVYPNEVEGVLLQVPGVAEATVSGARSPVTGMIVRAVLRLADGADPEAVRRTARGHCRDELEPFKVPALIEVSDAAQHSDRFKKVRAAA